MSIDPSREQTVRLELTERVPDEQLSPGTEYLRFVKLESERLSAFHGRPVFLRAGIILPRGFDDEPVRRYPLRVRVGGYGSRYTRVERMMAEESEFRKAWLADDAPRMILLHLDGDGPFGDSYQRIGFVGVGLQGSSHCRNLLRLDGVQRTAVCDIVEEKVTRVQD